MTDNGRLIINSRGETVQVIQSNDLRLQVITRDDAMYSVGSMWCSQLTLNPREAIALAAKLADAAGFAAEFVPVRHIKKYVPAKPGEGR